MAYYTSNAARAYDMQPSAAPDLGYTESPELLERPRFDVVTGAGRESYQAASPVFTHVVKVFVVLATLFCVLGAARVGIASATAATLNANAALTSTLENARAESSDLEVMRSVYGSKTRIRELAVEQLGMVESTDTVTIDLSEASAAAQASAE